MIQDTITKIEKRLADASIKPEKKRELLKLLRELKAEITKLAKTQREQSESIACFTHVSTHEATRKKRDPDLLKLSIDGLASSVKEFEASHPKLVDNVNKICLILSNMGI